MKKGALLLSSMMTIGLLLGLGILLFIERLAKVLQ